MFVFSSFPDFSILNLIHREIMIALKIPQTRGEREGPVDTPEGERPKINNTSQNRLNAIKK